MIEDLITCLYNYKVSMEYKGKDFDGDRAQQYSVVRTEMAKKYSNEYFGAEKAETFIIDDEQTPEEIKEKKNEVKVCENLIKTGYNRILEKVKDIRQKFSNALTSGTRSGSGKIILEHFDLLKQIYGGAPSAVKIPVSIDTSSVNNTTGFDQSDGDESDNNDNDDEFSNNQLSPNRDDLENTVSLRNNDDTESSNRGVTESENANPNKKKRKSYDNVIPKLIDNKRVHLEKKLSSSQRDSILLAEAREDIALRKEVINSINNSNEVFSNAMTGISDSIKILSETMAKSMQTLAQCMNPPQPQIPLQMMRPQPQLQVLNNFMHQQTQQQPQSFIDMMPPPTRDGNAYPYN